MIFHSYVSLPEGKSPTNHTHGDHGNMSLTRKVSDSADCNADFFATQHATRAWSECLVAINLSPIHHAGPVRCAQSWSHLFFLHPFLMVRKCKVYTTVYYIYIYYYMICSFDKMSGCVAYSWWIPSPQKMIATPRDPKSWIDLRLNQVFKYQAPVNLIDMENPSKQ